MIKRHIDTDFVIKQDDISDNGTFTGFASTFGGRPDSHGDIVAEGAFSKSLINGGRNGTGVVMLRGHNSDKVPGVWTDLREEKRGLKATGQLALPTPLGSETFELLKMKAIQHLSIGFSVKDFERDERTGVRTIKEAELWEISIVAFPANRGAKVQAVKSIFDAKDERELEQALREAGLSCSVSKYLAGKCKSSLREAGVVEESGMTEILDALKQIKVKLRR